MPRPAERKEHPLSMRLPDADLALIDRAAQARGRSRTDFVRDAAVRAAEDVLLEERLVRMTADGFAAFMAHINESVSAIPELVDVLKRPAPWESPSDERH